MCHILYYFNLKQQIFARFDFHTTQTNLSFKAGYLSAFQLKRRTFCGIFHFCPREIYIPNKKSGAVPPLGAAATETPPGSATESTEQ